MHECSGLDSPLFPQHLLHPSQSHPELGHMEVLGPGHWTQSDKAGWATPYHQATFLGGRALDSFSTSKMSTGPLPPPPLLKTKMTLAMSGMGLYRPSFHIFHRNAQGQERTPSCANGGTRLGRSRSAHGLITAGSSNKVLPPEPGWAHCTCASGGVT